MLLKKVVKVFLSVSLIVLSTNSYSEAQDNLNGSSNNPEIEKIVNKGGISRETTGINVVNLRTGKIIFQHNPNKPLAPASNMKLITSAASLALLKPEYKFKTSIYGDSYVRGGVLTGNLYLKGFGDPDLTIERLWRMVRKLKNTGIREVTGEVIADESFFDSKEVSEGWNVQRYGNAIYSARISALSLNRNTVDVWLRGGLKEGDKAIVTLEPENDFFQIDNQTVTRGGYPNVIISRTVNPQGKNIIFIKGNIPLNSHSEANKINLDNPGLYTGYVFYKLLQKEGIEVRGGNVKKGETPKSAIELVSSNSRTLASIVYDFNKHSVNIIGEILLKYLGATFKGPPGSAEKGAQVVKKEFFEKKVKMNASALNMIDGSGLSPLNKITSEHFIKTLEYMYKDFSLQSDYMASLPVAGADGTLRKRTRHTLGERKFRAKTGFINGVSALSGYTSTKNGEPIAFSILMNNFTNMGSAFSIQEGICTYLSNTDL